LAGSSASGAARLEAMAPTPTGPPLDVLVVASWFPAIDDSTRGRFIADQAQALLATGRVRPSVISFEPLGVRGGLPDRQRQVAAIEGNLGPVLHADPGLFNPGGSHTPTGIPVARLPIAGSGWGPGGTAHGSRNRDHALHSVAGRADLPAWSIVHAHTGYPDGAGAVGLARQLGLPLVITEHASFVDRVLADPWQRRAYLRGVRAASRFVAVSQTLADQLITAIPELEPKLVVIPNTVDVAAFAKAARVERRPAELLYVGYRTPLKAIDVLLDAFREIRATRPDATLRLIGRSPDEATEAGWQRQAAELGIADAVSFEPTALRPEIVAAMSRASLLVHPSRYETFGIAPVEALAAGLPVVGADIGSLRELLAGNPDLGALAPVGDAGALARTVLATLDRRASFDPAVLRAAVIERFGAAAVAGRLADLYAEVAALPRPVGMTSAKGAARPGPTSAAGTGRNPAIVPGPAARTPAADGGPQPPILIIGFDTPAAAALIRPLPASILGRCRLLCAAGPGAAELPSGLGVAITVDLAGAPEEEAASSGALSSRRRWRAAIRTALRDPLGTYRREQVDRRRSVHRAAACRAAVVTELARLRAVALTDDVEVIALDGRDQVALRGLLGPGVRLLPGSVRWLADRGAD
jgi:glycosyltransferase involved in cell wall biosynthesis